MLQNDLDGALINETHLKQFNEHFLNIPGYRLYHTERSNGSKGGTAILIRSTIDHTLKKSPPLANLETTQIEINIAQRNLLLTAAYNSPSPNKCLKKEDIQSILNTTTPVIVAGDLNAKSPLWHSRLTNRNGRTLHDLYLQTSNFEISSPETPTIHPHNQKHKADVLDIVLHKNCNFSITTETLELFDSDHYPVLLELHMGTSIQRTRTYRATNWKLFKLLSKNIVTKLPDDPTNSEIEETVERFTAELQLNLKLSTTTSEKRSDLPPAIKNLITEKTEPETQKSKLYVTN